ncbi:MAG: HAMP domain-containing histidine kinase [Ferrovum sp.]|nr:HAMP domain-containing histidine kinase [Ferrovum sp.]
MKRWFGPTLARRILVAALLAFVLSFLVITLFNFYQVFRDQDGELDINRKAFVESLSQALSGYSTDDQVRAAAEGVQRMIEAQMQQAHRPSSGHIQVWTQDGRQIYASLDLPEQRPPGLSSAANFEWKGQSYTVTSVVSSRYRIDILDPMPLQYFYKLFLQNVLGDLLLKMAIAFPLVLIPIWLAIHTGLRPLDTLSETLRQRPIDDLTPLALEMRYEELQPVIRAINELMERLRRKIQQEQSFVHDAAHELQTPLAVIANQTHVLASAVTPDERMEAHQNVEHAIERTGHLVRQMVVLFRLDSDYSGDWKTFDVAATVRELLSPLVSVALTRSIELMLKSPDNVPLHGDPGAFHSIVGNLVDNGLRYIGEGGRIHIEIGSNNGFVTLRVIDDGPGISEEDRERVFDRYFRVAGSRVSGSGLGLAIVKQAVIRMKGTITLENGLEGKGCTFEVTLPDLRPMLIAPRN